MERAGKTKYQIFIDDNFHYMDEDERIAGDVFDTAEEAIAAAKKIVDKSLRHEYRQHPGLSADELWGYGSAQESIMRIESSNIANELMKSIEGP